MIKVSIAVIALCFTAFTETVAIDSTIAAAQQLQARDSSIYSAGTDSAVVDTVLASPQEEVTVTSPLSSEVEEGSSKRDVRKIKLIKRDYNYKQQLFLAIGMMSFIALMMSSAQSWNPN